MHPYYHPLFVEFLVYFNDNQDYFEGHEVLEEYWKSIPGYSKSHPLTAYILLSTGMYHWRRGNLPGAFRTINKALQRFTSLPPIYDEYKEVVDFDRLIQDVVNAKKEISIEHSFRAMEIGIQSQQLNELVQTTAQNLILLTAGSDEVIHKHMQRDRSDILKLRNEKKKSGR
ncbi:DUF309 domain-containing protein [Sporosarcina sp. BI001-red]|uniref:DUF309 domain-containing protein n=1 Tax=Sporosarcina sp. BI001-red TaxID=2282866 RepID=UPI000E228E9E|nr:DUF309 domain-containing protein [Sporosarcina sp. BI001-red]REB09865.1 DUF309 domain-containing protein [Sporosarcina sp. BI001-red]